MSPTYKERRLESFHPKMRLVHQVKIAYVEGHETHKLKQAQHRRGTQVDVLCQKSQMFHHCTASRKDAEGEQCKGHKKQKAANRNLLSLLLREVRQTPRGFHGPNRDDIAVREFIVPGNTPRFTKRRNKDPYDKAGKDSPAPRNGGTLAGVILKAMDKVQYANNWDVGP